MGAVYSYETLLSSYKTTRCKNTKYLNLRDGTFFYHFRKHLRVLSGHNSYSRLGCDGFCYDRASTTFRLNLLPVCSGCMGTAGLFSGNALDLCSVGGHGTQTILPWFFSASLGECWFSTSIKLRSLPTESFLIPLSSTLPSIVWGPTNR